MSATRSSSLLFGVISGPDIQSAEHLYTQAKSFINGLELRLDHFKQIDSNRLKAFVKTCDLPIMFTLRRKDQGGSFPGTEKERLDLIESLCALQPAFVDLEYDVLLDFRKKLFEAYPKISFLSSYHDFTRTPKDLEALYEKIKTPYAHIYKIAVTAKSSIDTLRMLDFVQAHSNTEKIIGICMGEEGRATRILAPVVGGFLTYANISNATAPGQIDAQQIQDIYRFRKLNRKTAVYALIGDPVDKSLGHLIHNAVFAEQNINAVYLKIDVKQDDLAAFVTLASKLPFKGFSVTMPHKESILPFLTGVSPQTQLSDACNTIQINPEEWIGYNTDGIGALNAIEKRETVSGKHLVFIGAGGAAKALIFEAAERGALVTVINRTAEKAVELAKAVKGKGGGWDLLPKICEAGYDVIVNCIPESETIDEKWILPEKIAMDIVYIPKNTPFLIKASQKKCRVIFGYEMFVNQAVEQLRIWLPQLIDIDKAYATIEAKALSALQYN